MRFVLPLMLLCVSAYAQTPQDTLQLQEVVVTATRTEKALATVAMPLTLIPQKQIKQMGSLRLQEVLQEQTGLAIVNNHGQGIQMQGFSPDYTLILLDGEPIVGRTAGTLELSRLAVGNIKQIEVVKGASSSLYGSEALAGVVNIITENPHHTKAEISARYGANQTADFGAQASIRQEKWRGNIFVNRYSSGGYDFSPATFGKTVEPFHSYTAQSKWSYQISPTQKISLAGRFFTEEQEAKAEVGKGVLVAGKGISKDLNINPTWDWQITSRWKSALRAYYTQYTAASHLNYLADNKIFEESFFNQTFIRTEWQNIVQINEKNTLVAGAGKIWESVEATRYEGKKKFQTHYIFVQNEYTPTARWNVTLGGRIDQHTVYGAQASPKLALQYQISPILSLRASAGRGFKSPDFRQLYLNFNNAIAGYSVYGTEELPQILANLQAQNQLADILLPPSEIGKLQAESSWAFNIGAKLAYKNITFSTNIFRNDVQNLIESQTVARRTNGQSIFSYRNLESIFTQGVELDGCYRWKRWAFSAGYQFLQARDKAVVGKINNGEIYRRDAATLLTTRVRPQEYGGLFGRSRNMLNIKLFYEDAKGFTANLRGIFRGKYGLGDMNGNLILDEEQEYVQGYWLWNVAAGKEFFSRKLRLQIGLDNILNQTDAQNIPNLAGRIWWISMHGNFSNQKNK